MTAPKEKTNLNDDTLSLQEKFNNYQNNTEEINNRINPRITQEEQDRQVKNVALQVIDKVSKLSGTNLEESIIGTSLLLQSGAYNLQVPDRKIIVAGKEFTKKTLNTALDLVGTKYKLRRIATSIRDIIVATAKANKMPGNLFNQYKSYNPEILKEKEEIILEHMIYCTDFNSDNPNAPRKVLEFLAQRNKGAKSNNKSKNK